MNLLQSLASAPSTQLELELLRPPTPDFSSVKAATYAAFEIAQQLERLDVDCAPLVIWGNAELRKEAQSPMPSLEQLQGPD